MELYSDSDAPTLDPGVTARLQRLDPLLRVTFCRYAIDQVTGEPLAIHPGPEVIDEPEYKMLRRCGNVTVLLDPGFHLWVRDPDGKHHLLSSYPAEIGFGHREVRKLEEDVARYMRPSEILATMHQQHADRKKREAKNHDQGRADILKANEHRIHDLLFEDKCGYRSGKFMSGPGLHRRGNIGDVRMDDTEDGWEKPSPK